MRFQTESVIWGLLFLYLLNYVIYILDLIWCELNYQNPNIIIFLFLHGQLRNSDDLNDAILNNLKTMLDEHNPIAKAFRMARDRFKSNDY